MLFDHASCTVHQIIIINCPIFIITNVDLTLINKNKIVRGWRVGCFFTWELGGCQFLLMVSEWMCLICLCNF